MRAMIRDRRVWWTAAAVAFMGAMSVYQRGINQGAVYGWLEDSMRVAAVAVMVRFVSFRRLVEPGRWRVAALFAAAIALSLTRYDTLRYGLTGDLLDRALLSLRDFAFYLLLVKGALAFVEEYRRRLERRPERQGSDAPFGVNGAFWGIFGVTLLCLCLRWGLLYFPFRPTTDVTDQLAQIETNSYSNLQPLGHTLFLRLCLTVFGSLSGAVFLQILMIALLNGLFANYLCRCQRAPYLLVLALTTIYLGLMPSSLYMYPWRDAPYTFLIGVLTYYVLRLVDREHPLRLTVPHGLALGASLAWCMLFRFNGLVPVGLTLAFLVCYILRRGQWKPLIAIVCAMAASIGGLYGYAYGALKAESPPNGSPYQVFGSGIAAVVANDGRITPEQYERIRAVLPVDFMREHYTPWHGENLLWVTEEVPSNPLPGRLAANPGEVVRLYFELLPANLGICLRDILYNTFEVWGVMYLFSNATLLYMLFIAAAAAWSRRTWRAGWPVFLPVLGNVASIAVSTITNEIRYLLPTYALFVPLLVYILCGHAEDGAG